MEVVKYAAFQQFNLSREELDQAVKDYVAKHGGPSAEDGKLEVFFGVDWFGFGNVEEGTLEFTPNEQGE